MIWDGAGLAVRVRSLAGERVLLDLYSGERRRAEVGRGGLATRCAEVTLLDTGEVLMVEPVRLSHRSREGWEPARFSDWELVAKVVDWR